MSQGMPQIPPEVLEAMLGLSEQDEEQKLLDKQLAMGNKLANQAVGYQGQATGLGGAASALAQGLAGYGAGTQMKNYDSASQAGMTARKGRRKTYFDWVTGGQQAGPSAEPFDE